MGAEIERQLLEVSGADAPSTSPSGLVEALAAVPEEEVWLAGLRSEQTRKAYKRDVADFLETLGIKSREELHQTSPMAVIAWREELVRRGLKNRSVRRRLSALSSLFQHLVSKQLVQHNPVREVLRPNVAREQGVTKALSAKQARAVLDAPPADTVLGLRDRVLLAIGLQVGLRRSEIAHLRVQDFHLNLGYWSLRYTKKGAEDISVAVNATVAKRIEDYLCAAGHGDEPASPLLLPLRGNQHTGHRNPDRHISADGVDRVFRRWVKASLGITHGYSAHSMRATYITEALTRGAALEDVQRDVGHASPTTTKLYDRRGHNPEKATSFFVNY